MGWSLMSRLSADELERFLARLTESREALSDTDKGLIATRVGAALYG